MGYPTINELIAKFEGYGTSAAPTITAANNPGAIQYGSFAVQHGAIGNANGFAVFPDPQTGWNALDRLAGLKIDAGATPQSLIQGGPGILGWAPPATNPNSAAYSQFIANGAGIGINQPIAGAVPASIIAPPGANNSGNLSVPPVPGLPSILGGSVPTIAGAVSSAASGALWFARLSLAQIVAMILGFVLIIFGLLFLRSIQSGIVTVQGHVQKGAKLVAALAP